MLWAKENRAIVITHDLDFGAILAATHADAPSVIQVRAQDLTPDALQATLFQVIAQHQAHLEAGALLVVDKFKQRVRILPLN